MSFKIKVNFIDVFKIGDNINYNLSILKKLYEIYENTNRDNLLIKPIVLLNTAIVEAILFDFVVNRLKRPYSSEILFIDIFNLLKNRELKKFEHYITQIEKHNLFKEKDNDFYNAIRSLYKKRNRIHIQNEKWEDPRDEINLFNEKSKILSEKVLEKLLKTMTNEFPRREKYHEYVEDFELPWNEHFK